MSALVDTMQDGKKCDEKFDYIITVITTRLPELPVNPGKVFWTAPASTINIRENDVNHNECKPESLG